MSTRKVKRSVSVRVEKVLMPRQASPIAMERGRVLAGWASPAQTTIHAQMSGDQDEQLRLLKEIEARRAYADQLHRPLNQSGLVLEIPKELEDYSAEFQKGLLGSGAIQEGSSVAYMDLSKLGAFQVYVREPAVSFYCSMLQPGDLLSAAKLALPIEVQTHLQAGFDSYRGTWTVTSEDSNLQKCGQSVQQNPDGTIAFGISFRVAASIVKVQRYLGRYYLCDGYHRSVALLRSNVRRSLVLVRDVSTLEELGAYGHLPFDRITGLTPPVLADYDDERLSIELNVPAGGRRFIVMAQEAT